MEINSLKQANELLAKSLIPLNEDSLKNVLKYVAKREYKYGMLARIFLKNKEDLTKVYKTLNIGNHKNHLNKIKDGPVILSVMIDNTYGEFDIPSYYDHECISNIKIRSGSNGPRELYYFKLSLEECITVNEDDLIECEVEHYKKKLRK